MPPKRQSKTDLAKKQKVVEDKTFGLNKNKSRNVQSLKQPVQPKPDLSKVAVKMPPKRRGKPPILPRRELIRSERKEATTTVPDIVSVQLEQREERGEEGSPPRVRRRVQEEDEYMPPPASLDDLRALRQEMTDLLTQNRILREEVAELRAESRALREEMTRERIQAPPALSAPMLRRADRILNDEGISVNDFFKLKTPEFRGELDEDPQEFLEETEKIVRMLRCSDARIIELVGLKFKGNAWDWFQRNIEEKLYGANSLTWEEFKETVIDEFFLPSERENRALQFERLRQTNDMSVTEYAKEFIRLSKYAQAIVPTEAARVARFKWGLITPLYTALAAPEFPTLSKLIDKARLCERRIQEEILEREQRRTEKSKRHNSQNRSDEVSFDKRQVTQPTQSTFQSQFRRGQGRGQLQSTSVYSTPEHSQDSIRIETQPCDICGKRHAGQCWFASKICFWCKQPGHYARDCLQKVTQPLILPTSNIIVQMENLSGDEPVGGGRLQGPTPF